MESEMKRKTKLHNAVRVLKKINERYPSFTMASVEPTPQTDSASTKDTVVTFAKLLREIEVEDK